MSIISVFFYVWLRFESVILNLFNRVRKLCKWVLRRTTGLCELQRICYGSPSGAPRVLAIKSSLSQSSVRDIQSLCDTLNKKSDALGFSNDSRGTLVIEALRTISKCKKIKPNIHPEFFKSLAQSITAIWGYRQLCAELKKLTNIPFDSENKEHEAELLLLWHLLMPDQPLQSRVTKQWQDIGFQGNDPKTDFRGTGILGLENLLYFAKTYTTEARYLLMRSHHPENGYEFAIVGINITYLTYQMLQDESAETHFYNSCKQCPSVKDFHELYCYLFYEFDSLWFEEKKTIMEFPDVKRKFDSMIRNELSKNTASFRMNATIDV